MRPVKKLRFNASVLAGHRGKRSNTQISDNVRYRMTSKETGREFNHTLGSTCSMVPGNYSPFATKLR